MVLMLKSIKRRRADWKIVIYVDYSVNPVSSRIILLRLCHHLSDGLISLRECVLNIAIIKFTGLPRGQTSDGMYRVSSSAHP